MASNTNEEPSGGRPFIPAKWSPWLVALAETLIRIELSFTNRVHIRDSDLSILRDMPRGSGMILTPNHADEMDPHICWDLARRARKRFIFMCNREAFDEWNGAAGWGLQRLGVFSVERGGHDKPAKKFSVSVVRDGRDVLVIFPEGEIFYLNDSVQPFHSGAIDIGINAILERRQFEPDWNAYIIPLAIKYRYSQEMEKILEHRVHELEVKLSRDMQGYSLRKRLSMVLAEVLQQEELKHDLQIEGDKYSELSTRVTQVRREILAQMELKYKGIAAAQSRTIDRAWQISAHVRELMASSKDPERKAVLEKDLSNLKEVAQMESWQPHYWEGDPSIDRLAEALLKMEREILHIKRPRQLAHRDVYLRVGKPIKLADYIEQFQADAHKVRHDVAEELRGIIQSMIDVI